MCIRDSLKGENFELYPGFVTGGFIDVSRYNDGKRGGKVRIRAKIEKVDNKTLAITEIPYSLTTGSLIESILKAFEKGKIKIRKIDDNTAEKARIICLLYTSKRGISMWRYCNVRKPGPHAPEISVLSTCALHG